MNTFMNVESIQLDEVLRGMSVCFGTIAIVVAAYRLSDLFASKNLKTNLIDVLFWLIPLALGVGAILIGTGYLQTAGSLCFCSTIEHTP